MLKRKNLIQLLQEQIEKANPRRKLTSEEARCLVSLYALADKIKSLENMKF